MRDGWQTIRLGEACDIYQPKTISKKEMLDEGPYPVFGANGIIGRYSQYNHEEPQLLITCRGATCGAVNVSLPKSWITGNAMVVRPKSPDIDIRYLEYFCRGGLDYSAVITGAAQPQITRKSLAPQLVWYPPLPEQKRIVAILDEAFAGIATAVANTEKNLANARELFESYLNSVFSKQNEGWRRKRLREVTSKIGSGATPRGGQSAYKEQGTSLIRSLNVYDRRFEAERLAFIDDAQAARLSNVIVSEGDVLFNITGASIARCCAAPPAHLPARVNQHVAILRPVPSELTSEFLCYLMTSRAYKDRLLGIGDEGGSTRQAITKSQLENLAIALPARDEQSQIVDDLQSLEAESRRLAYIFEQKLMALGELRQSLLQKAFSGELTAGKAASDVMRQVEEIA